jgi:hypothetical protein
MILFELISSQIPKFEALILTYDIHVSQSIDLVSTIFLMLEDDVIVMLVVMSVDLNF